MPKALEDKLKRQGRKKGFKGDRLDAYVYGSIENIEKKRSKKKATTGNKKRGRRGGK